MVDEGDTVTLNGNDSTDPDGDDLTYLWTQTHGPTVTLTGANTATASFTAPDVDSNTSIVFTLTVSDGNGGIDTDIIAITVTATMREVAVANRPPTVNAANDLSLDEGTSFRLSANATDPDGTP